MFSSYIEGEANPRKHCTQRINPEAGAVFEPYQPERPVSYNELPTSYVSQQPGTENRYEVYRVIFNTGSGDGSRYYIYDRRDDEFEYFAQLLDFQELTFVWHPLGDTLYYRYPNDDKWYAFITGEGDHVILGDLPDGTWSRNGRYRARWITIPQDERELRIKEARPILLVSGLESKYR